MVQALKVLARDVGMYDISMRDTRAHHMKESPPCIFLAVIDSYLRDKIGNPLPEALPIVIADRNNFHVKSINLSFFEFMF